jgi:methylated-DNA-protein-cysteine methyltransferase-like protein
MTENNFFGMVYEVVKLIPYGRVTSYGAIAAYLGAKSSSRTVGWALNVSHGPFSEIPAHRVVNRNGILSGKAHFGGDRMQTLLEQEGILVNNDKIVNFKEVFWDPKELEKEMLKG